MGKGRRNWRWLLAFGAVVDTGCGERTSAIVNARICGRNYEFLLHGKSAEWGLGKGEFLFFQDGIDGAERLGFGGNGIGGFVEGDGSGTP